jgi:hypothetical protein
MNKIVIKNKKINTKIFLIINKNAVSKIKKK